MRHDLGYFDLEQKALQHLDNQSWSRLACGPDCPRPNWLPAWTPASQRSPDRRAARRCRAPKRSCATPWRPAASSTCGCRRLDAAFANGRQRYRAKSYSGAPPPIRNLSKPIRLGLSSRVARNAVDHGVDLGDHKLGRGVLHHVADTGRYDQFRPC
jgi:hypothetical protein